jgi:hypothetical protein
MACISQPKVPLDSGNEVESKPRPLWRGRSGQVFGGGRHRGALAPRKRFFMSSHENLVDLTGSPTPKVAHRLHALPGGQRWYGIVDRKRITPINDGRIEVLYVAVSWRLETN